MLRPVPQRCERRLLHLSDWGALGSRRGTEPQRAACTRTRNERRWEAVVRWVLAIALALGLSFTGRARASDGVLEVAVDYSAPQECPAETAFWGALQARTRRVSRAQTDDAPIRLKVDLQPGGDSVLGRLEIVRDGLISEPRYVRASECRDVLEALALTAALGIDPEALTRPPDETPPESQPPETTPSYYDAPDPLPTTPLTWHSALSVGALSALPVDLRMSWGGTAAWSFRSEGGPNWAPAISLGVNLLRSDIFDDSEVAAFGLYTGHLQACPLRLQAESWTLRPCGVVQGGVLTAAGRNISNPEGTERTWLSLGVALEVEYAMSSNVYLQLVLAGHAPMTPQVYVLTETSSDSPLPADTKQELARTPALVPWVGLGLVNRL